MKRRAAVLVATIAAFLCTAASALATTYYTSGTTVDNNIAHAFNNVEASGGAKWVQVDGRHTAGSGGWTGSICTRTFNTTSGQNFFSEPLLFKFDIFNTYSNNGTYIRMGGWHAGGAC